MLHRLYSLGFSNLKIGNDPKPRTVWALVRCSEVLDFGALWSVRQGRSPCVRGALWAAASPLNVEDSVDRQAGFTRILFKALVFYDPSRSLLPF